MIIYSIKSPYIRLVFYVIFKKVPSISVKIGPHERRNISIIMKIITFGTLKGGVGKTMLCFNIGGILAQNGKKVLEIGRAHV